MSQEIVVDPVFRTRYRFERSTDPDGTLVQHVESERVQMQPVRIAVLCQFARLAPFGSGKVDMRPVHVRRLAASAWDRNQKAG